MSRYLNFRRFVYVLRYLEFFFTFTVSEVVQLKQCNKKSSATLFLNLASQETNCLRLIAELLGHNSRPNTPGGSCALSHKQFPDLMKLSDAFIHKLVCHVYEKERGMTSKSYSPTLTLLPLLSLVSPSVLFPADMQQEKICTVNHQTISYLDSCKIIAILFLKLITLDKSCLCEN